MATKFIRQLANTTRSETGCYFLSKVASHSKYTENQKQLI